MRQTEDTFFLNCSIESLNVSIVVGFPDPGVAMFGLSFQKFLGKELAKLRAMVGLDCVEMEWCSSLSSSDEGYPTSYANPWSRLSVGPARVDI
jgi:hypothetical protein